MSSGVPHLLSRRLLIVTGKGGVGKSSVAAALGLLAARRGIDTVVIEVGGDASALGLLWPPGTTPTAGDGRTPVEISPHLFGLRLDPESALREYLELQLRVRTLARAVVGAPGLRRLLDAAPGWRELITLGKLWHLESQRERSRPRWGLLVVDAPATGHGLSLLSVPQVVLDTVRLGPLRRHTDWVVAMLRDPERTLVLPVTLAEELPVKETLELRESIAALGIALGPLVANGVSPAPELPALEDLLPALARTSAPPLPDGQDLCEIVEHVVRRSARQRALLDGLTQTLGEPPLELPQLARGISGRADTEKLCDLLEHAFAHAGVSA